MQSKLVEWLLQAYLELQALIPQKFEQLTDNEKAIRPIFLKCISEAISKYISRFIPTLPTLSQRRRIIATLPSSRKRIFNFNLPLPHFSLRDCQHGQDKV